MAAFGLGCDALWGLSDLTYGSATGTGAAGGSGGLGGQAGMGAAGSGASAGAGGSGASAGSGGSGGTAGTGGSGPPWVDLTLTIGERPGSDVVGATSDTTVEADNPTWNFGATDNFGPDADPDHIALLRFDLSSLPIGSIAVSAQVELVVCVCASCEAEANTVAVYEVLEPWTEGTADHAPGVANYTERSSNSAWTTPGVGLGSRDASPFAEFDPNVQGQAFFFDLPLELVQQWLDAPGSNFGMSLESVPTSGLDGICFRSSENTTTESRPLLHLHVQVPG